MVQEDGRRTLDSVVRARCAEILSVALAEWGGDDAAAFQSMREVLRLGVGAVAPLVEHSPDEVRAWEAGAVPIPEAALVALAAAVRRVFESPVTEAEYAARCAYSAAAVGVTPQVVLQYTDAGPPCVASPLTVT